MTKDGIEKRLNAAKSEFTSLTQETHFAPLKTFRDENELHKYKYRPYARGADLYFSRAKYTEAWGASGITARSAWNLKII